MILKFYLQDKLADMQDKGELVESGQHDILTEALGTPKFVGSILQRAIYSYCTT